MLGGHRARRGLPREGRALTKQCPRGMGTVGVWGLGRQGSSLWGAKSLGAAMSEGPHTCLLGSMPRRHGQEGAPGLVYLSTLGTHRKERDGLGGHSDVKGSVRWRQMRRNIKTTSSAIPTQGHKWSCGIQEVSRPGPTNAPSGKPWFSTQTHIHKHMHPHAPTCTHMNTCTHMYARTCIYTCDCAYTYMHTTHLCTHTCNISWTYTHTCTQAPSCTHTCTHMEHAHTYTLVHMCPHIHVCAHTYTHTRALHMHTHLHRCSHRRVHTCTGIHGHIHIQITHLHLHTHLRVHIHTCTHVHTSTYTHKQWNGKD